MTAHLTTVQLLIHLIQNQIPKTDLVTGFTRLKDRLTGADVDIDLVLVTSVAGSDYTLGLEVLNSSRKANSAWVEQIYKKDQNLPVDQLIIVSRSGFTRKALRVSELLGTEPLSFLEMADTDWNLALKNIKNGYVSVATYSVVCKGVLEPGTGRAYERELPLDTVIYLPNGSKTNAVTMVAESFLSADQKSKIVEKELILRKQDNLVHAYISPKGTFTIDNSKRVLLQKMMFYLKLIEVASCIRFARKKSTKNKIIHTIEKEGSRLIQLAYFKSSIQGFVSIGLSPG